jgi:glycosyltransferase involved in cell wall biosynthesis
MDRQDFCQRKRTWRAWQGTFTFFWKNPALRVEMGLKARERVERFFDIKKRAAELEHLYDQVVRGECGAGL